MNNVIFVRNPNRVGFLVKFRYDGETTSRFTANAFKLETSARSHLDYPRLTPPVHSTLQSMTRPTSCVCSSSLTRQL